MRGVQTEGKGTSKFINPEREAEHRAAARRRKQARSRRPQRQQFDMGLAVRDAASARQVEARRTSFCRNIMAAVGEGNVARAVAADVINRFADLQRSRRLPFKEALHSVLLEKRQEVESTLTGNSRKRALAAVEAIRRKFNLRDL